ncbi:MAG: DUF3782 domain-containing protein, partial [Nitrososphaerota archaeon]
MAARERLKSRILKLLREDEEFRYAVAGLIGLDEILKRLDRHESHIIEILKRLDRHEERFLRIEQEIGRIWQEIEKLREDMNRLREDMMKGFEAVNRQISALGARWGLMSEEAFREGLKGILEKELGLKVERWTAFDEGGEVFGFPSPVEVDVAVKDGKTLLIEVSSQVRPSDVVTLYRKAKLYERKTG